MSNCVKCLTGTNGTWKRIRSKSEKQRHLPIYSFLLARALLTNETYGFFFYNMSTRLVPNELHATDPLISQYESNYGRKREL